MNKPILLDMDMTMEQIARDAIALFLEYRDGYGYDEDRALSQTVSEFAEAAEFIKIKAKAKETK